ncbi:hypothetical protein [Scatolibacter rhodanostii]|uniref:hypothetical protein n=1 Tax=Scatolibacter rhodanostii TaxID=2014781 RepID=UPI000C08519E|nr:hypothetical protein [Scatolibacter rhodanostii]
MDFRLISIPPFKAVSSGADKDFDFSENGILGKFNTYFSKLTPDPADNFTPRDYLYFDEQKGGMVWIYALTDYIESEDFETFDFAGGLYLTYHYKDGNHATNERLYQEALSWISKSELFELDKRENHYPMGHIITPQNVIKVLGWAQMEAFVPIKLK